MVIVADDGNIFTKNELLDYLDNLGFNKTDVINLLISDEIDKYESLTKTLSDSADEYELLYDGATNNMRCFQSELDVIVDKLESGKGLTKAEAAKQLKYYADCYLN